MARSLIKILVALVVAWAIVLLAYALLLYPWYSRWGASSEEASRHLPGVEPVAQAGRQASAPASPANGMAVAILEPGRALVFVRLVEVGTGQIDDAGGATPGRCIVSLAWTLEEASSGKAHLTSRAYAEHRLRLPPGLAHPLSRFAQAWAWLRRLLFAGLVAVQS